MTILFLFKTFVPAVIVLASGAFAQPAPSPIVCDAPQTQWVAHSLTQMQSIHVGMTRGQLLRVFQPEGGTYSREGETYVYRGCPYFKVRVEFHPVGKASEIGSPNDKITAISQPFLEEPVYN